MGGLSWEAPRPEPHPVKVRAAPRACTPGCAASCESVALSELRLSCHPLRSPPRGRGWLFTRPLLGTAGA